jgi:6-phosphogluconolactonase (cycloisomerase 2 family)
MALAGGLLFAVAGCEGEADQVAIDGPPPPKSYVANHAYTLQTTSIDISKVDAGTGAFGAAANHNAGLGAAPRGAAADAAGKFLYVPDESGNFFTAFTVNATTGALTVVQPYPLTGNLTAAAVGPNGKFLYVVNFSAQNVSAYAINGTTGALTIIAGSPFGTGPNPKEIAIDPSGKFLYVVNNFTPGSVSAFTVNASTGALTAVAGSPFLTGGGNSFSLAVDPTGKFVYVANGGVSSVSGFSIDTTTGVLTPVAGSPFTVGSSPYAVATDGSGKYLYVGHYAPNPNLRAYSIDGTSGAITEITGSPYAAFSASIFPNLQHARTDPSGKFLYVSNEYATDGVDGFSINPTTGQLTHLAGFPVVGLNTKDIVITRKPK